MGGSGSGRRAEALREAQVDEFAKLNEWGHSLNDSMKLRANVILLLLGGMTISDTCERLGVNAKTVYQWRARWNARGLEGLYTRQKRFEANNGGVSPSLKQKIEAFDHTDIGPSEMKGLFLQFIRDVRRDKPDEVDRTGAKLQLDALKELNKLIMKDGAAAKAESLPEDFARG